MQLSQFDPENKQLAAARSLPVVLVCKAGQASADAAKRLRKAGFEQVYCARRRHRRLAAGRPAAGEGPR